ncbi:molybdate ABC transporter substrate-binding protein [Actinocorallia sp. API 0066]|uniref:molybdate ABC transporter substrate-binding protein n=1 Tax=Actinocorallia sp. API 0066 TaxID=2896846 RepID=UPI001E45946C|nr:molybdate ABC transporter substrate-binding protein [Actinocorallia sp. API 0066]MCD0450640.1 molybdate ABC transporter substrate-binding protein [Actinocorallia sp. API 0066]
MFKRALTLALPALLALTTAACGGSSGDGAAKETTLTVFAAASLTETFTELGKSFEAANDGVTVKFNFGSSATLAQQITQGAPADVFAAASPATMQTVADAALAEAPTTFVSNKLEIAVPAGNPAKVDDFADLANKGVKVALCAEQVPCGAAAKKAIEAAGLKITPVTLEQDVKATLTKVTLGEVDAALVYRTDVIAAGDKVEGIEFPEAEKAINDYPVAVLKNAPAKDLAQLFVTLVLSQQAKDLFTKAGFTTTP